MKELNEIKKAVEIHIASKGINTKDCVVFWENRLQFFIDEASKNLVTDSEDIRRKRLGDIAPVLISLAMCKNVAFDIKPLFPMYNIDDKLVENVISTIYYSYSLNDFTTAFETLIGVINHFKIDVVECFKEGYNNFIKEY